MRPSLVALLAATRSSLRTRAELHAEILALRHQPAVLQQAAPRGLRLSRADRFLWVLLSRVWSGWRGAVQIVQPATVLRWHRRLFAWQWHWRSRPARLGRPPIAADVRALIRQMHRANPVWGAPRILQSSPPLVGALVLSASWGFHLYLFPWHHRPGSHVPYESPDKSHAAYTPDAAWPVSRRLPCCSQGMQKTPVLASGKGFRCFRRRFVCTHLSYLHMT